MYSIIVKKRKGANKLASRPEGAPSSHETKVEVLDEEGQVGGYEVGHSKEPAAGGGQQFEGAPQEVGGFTRMQDLSGN